MEMEMVQIRGVDSTIRTTTAELEAGARLVVRERLMTHGDQKAESIYVVTMKGAGSSADVVSRSVAKDNSWQKFDSRLVGRPPVPATRSATRLSWITRKFLPSRSSKRTTSTPR